MFVIIYCSKKRKGRFQEIIFAFYTTNTIPIFFSPECLKKFHRFLENHKNSMSPKIPHYHSHIAQFGAYGLVSAIVNHYFCVLYPNLDVTEAARLMADSDQAELYEMEMEEAKKSGKESPREVGVAREKRVAMVVKAAHDVRII